MIIETRSGRYVNSDRVTEYFVNPVYRNEPANEFTGHVTRPLNYLEVRAVFEQGFCVLGKYFTYKSANEALRSLINCLRNGDDFHSMTREGEMNNVQPG